MASSNAHSSASVPRAGWARWTICGLLFLATTINYIDRQVFALLGTTLGKEYEWNEIDYGQIVSSFQLAYALGYLLTGRLIDRLGVRWGLALAVFVWSLASGLHGFMSSVAGFCVARFLLGLAEGGNFPAAIKAVGEWFPRRERAFATGIFNSGSNVGALIAPLAVPWISYQYGWPMAFFATAALGAVWLLLWLPAYRPLNTHPWVSPAELEYICSDPPDPPAPVAWITLLRYRQTWAFTIAMFLISPVWGFYLNWLPRFLQKEHGLNLIDLGPPLVVIYLMTDVGSIGGGWLSSHLIGQGWSVGTSRKTAMLLCAACVMPVYMASQISDLPWVVLVIGLAAAAHQGFSANLYTIVTDTMPTGVASSVVGIGGMAGALGGMLSATIIGHILEWTHSYRWPFLWASVSYLLAIAVLHCLLPKNGMAIDETPHSTAVD
jgi:MFS transporter, ACS family, hexuronate transporter